MRAAFLGLTIALGACAAAPPEEAPTTTLVEGAWELPAGVEGYRCVYFTPDRRLSIRSIEAIAPPGTHHTVLGTAESYDGPDGAVACTAADVGDSLLFGTGLGTTRLELPEGTALVVEAGTRLVLNLHLVNPNAEPLTGVSGLRVRVTDEGAVEHELGSTFAGSTEFTIPPASAGEVEGSCTATVEGGIVGLMPHMHQLGTHLVADLVRADGSVQTLHDAPYEFDDQRYAVFDPPVRVEVGDRVRVRCTYDNTTDESVGFGNSSFDEMCFASLLRYPRSGGAPICDDARPAD